MRHPVRAAALASGICLFAGPAMAAMPVRHATDPNVRATTQHVIVIVQENRTVDNLFQTLPGAETQNYGYDSSGNKIMLTPLPLGTPNDPGHSHGNFVSACNAPKLKPAFCRMNGFNNVACTRCPADTSYTYVDPADIAPYTQLATQYSFADRVLQGNEGPSFPGHLYLIAGQSGEPGSNWYVSENPTPRKSGAENCLAQLDHVVVQIDMTTPYPGTEGDAIYPCIDPMTILDELDSANISWRYYTPSLGSIWTAPLAVEHLYENSGDYAKVITPETTVLSDIQSNNLQQVSYVIPSAHDSDHPGPKDPNGGPGWVASIVNAVGESPYWSTTTILVVWDDWGGWFDHVRPVHATNPFNGVPDPYEYGFRVPLLAIGPHAKSGYISHRPRSSAAILHFIENVFGLPSLGTLDAQTDDLSDMFTASGAVRSFKPISTNGVRIRDLIRRPPDPTPVDED